MTSLHVRSPAPRIRARSAALDVLRVAVFALVVIRHTYSDEWVGQATLMGWSTPFFFIITGWLWTRGKRSTVGEPYVSGLGEASGSVQVRRMT